MAEKQDMSINYLSTFFSYGSPSKSPYKKTPPVRVKCVAKKAVVKVVDYTFSEQGITASKSKTTIHFGLCDHSSVIKATVEETLSNTLGTEMEEGRCYIIRNYGYIPARGNSSEQLFLKSGTVIYHSGNFPVSNEVEQRAIPLIQPPSRLVRMDEATGNLNSLITLEGKVITVSVNFAS